MAEVVLDASAILAVILEEPGASVVSGMVRGAQVSAVNAAEVVARLTDLGASEGEIRTWFAELGFLVVPFELADAWPTGLLRRRTRHEKLSLGDRACLALALARGVPAVTTDRAWGRLGLGKSVRVVPR